MLGVEGVYYRKITTADTLSRLAQGSVITVTESVVHSSLRKIMHVTACCMPCMQHVSATRPPLGPVRPRVCEMLDMNFREFLFHELG
jgi:hypothetical protein